MRRTALALLMLATGAGLMVTASLAGTPSRSGGTFRIAVGGIDSVDPALSYSAEGWALLDTTCARLMNYPDKPPPEGLRLVPEVAAGYPRVSNGGKTFTFVIRKGFRFSDGTRLGPSAFARTVNRTLLPGIDSPGAKYTRDIAGAEAVLEGRSPAASGIVTRGNRLVFHLTRPTPDFASRTTMPFFCAVPPTLPPEPEGVGAFPAAGPYYVSQYVRGRRIVLRRNRYYAGKRPHHVDRFEVDITGGAIDQLLGEVESGRADWAAGIPGPLHFDPARRLVAKYGINRSRFWVKP